jgi:hypothetical protein
MKALALLLAMAASPALGDDLSSLAFKGSIGLIIADGNITSWDLDHGWPGWGEGNPFAKPISHGYIHYTYDLVVIPGCVLLHDGLKNLDKSLGLGDFGTKDLFTLAIIGGEIVSISGWSKDKDDIAHEIWLTETEVFLSSALLNIQF